MGRLNVKRELPDKTLEVVDEKGATFYVETIFCATKEEERIAQKNIISDKK